MSYLKLSMSAVEVSLYPKAGTKGLVINVYFAHRQEAQHAIPDNAQHGNNALRTADRSAVTPLRRIVDRGNRCVHGRRRCIRMNRSSRPLHKQRYKLADHL